MSVIRPKFWKRYRQDPEAKIRQAPVTGRTVAECMRNFSPAEWRMWIRAGGAVPARLRGAARRATQPKGPR